MQDFLLSSANLPFTIALGLMVGIGVLEGVTTVFGVAASHFIESMFPSIDLNVDLSLDAVTDGDMAQIGSPFALSSFLGWLNIGKLPVLVMVVLFLLGFGAVGLTVQSVALTVWGRFFPIWGSLLLSLGGTVVFVRVAGNLLSKIIPKDETEAVSERSFIGRVAVIIMGTATRGQPAQAKLRDQHGRTHYVMVEPEHDGMFMASGAEVLLVMQIGSVFYGVPIP